jgi:hypothetical protein
MMLENGCALSTTSVSIVNKIRYKKDDEKYSKLLKSNQKTERAVRRRT